MGMEHSTVHVTCSRHRAVKAKGIDKGANWPGLLWC